MKRREKIILGIVAGVGLIFAFTLFRSMFLDPLRELDNRIAAAQLEKLGLEKTERDVMSAQATLVSAQKVSLPPNRSEAHRLYQNWVAELAQASGFQNIRQIVVTQRAEGTVFVASPVTINADATYDQLVRFLRRFHEVSLLHRITTLDATAASTEPNSRLRIVLTAEGVSMPNAPPRATLFPETALTADATADQTALTIEPAEGFPIKTPFRVRIGPEWVTVTEAATGRWTVQRGADGSKPIAHAAGQKAELVQTHAQPARNEAVAQAFETLAAINPYMKPRPRLEYRPRVTPAGLQTVMRGTPFSLTLKAENWDPAYGKPLFAIQGDAPEGLSLNEESGALKWDPPSSVATGEYKLRVVATGADEPSASVPVDLTLKLRNPNRPPKFKPVTNPRAYLGRLLTLDLSAEDPDQGDRLSYSLSGNVPQGAQLDARTGRFTWTPSEDLDAGDIRIEVSVTDTGDPPQTVRQNITIRTEEDAAKARLSGIIGVNGQMEAWFYDALSNKRTYLRVNDALRFADIEGKVVGIESDRVVFETGGKRMQVDIGSSVRDMRPAPDPPPVAGDPPATTVSPGVKAPPPRDPGEPSDSANPDPPRAASEDADETLPSVNPAERAG
ncbi:MAG: putative Ig domain-containing protein [Planctomyces sp.]|nr:putative Ig domain-containing protein [Planctomyces sp.]